MTSTIVRSDYQRVSPWVRPLAVVKDVIMRDLAGNGGPLQADAVIDSGAEMVLVPFGTPERYGWTVGALPDAQLKGVGVHMSRRFSVTVRIHNITYHAVAYELSSESDIRVPILGNSILNHMDVLLKGRPQKTLMRIWPP